MKSKKAFTLIELLVVIAIIGILATISVIALSNARAKSRDAKRAGDMKQIQTALELFFNDNNRYPTSTEWATGRIFSTSSNGTSTYMQVIPTASTPADGNCTANQNTFSYTQTENGNSYTISLCLGNTTGTLTPGPKCLTPGGIIEVDCSGDGTPVFVCGTSTLAYGGENYPTVDINGQCWLAKNLNVGTQICNSGTTCVTEPDDTFSTSTIEKYCYINDLSSCTTYGALYLWPEIMGLPNKCKDDSYDCTTDPAICDSSDNDCDFATTPRQGICPSGWHIPSDAEWTILETYLGGASVAGDELREAGATHWDSPNTGATNSSGFTALGAGVRGADGSFGYQGAYAYFWLSSISGSGAWDRRLDLGHSVSHYVDGRANGFSVRCLRD